jgi:hypothetical protein
MTRWNETHADDGVGACGCSDYHAADCPLRTVMSYLSTPDAGDLADAWYR